MHFETGSDDRTFVKWFQVVSLEVTLSWFEYVQISDEKIRNSVTESGYKIAGVISQAGEAQTQRIRETAEQAIGEQVMQIPVTIEQRRRGRLTGFLTLL